jgi:predicted TIM-barrel fold metal-dependent hydrolase
MTIRGDREADVWLSDEQLAKLTRADEANLFHSPIPTQMVSNGEHMPIPQTEDQKRVEARIKEIADQASKRLNISRRQFLAGTGGMAAGFLAMNDVYGQMFKVDVAELFEPAAHAKNGPPADLFVLDDQLHMVRSSMPGPQFFRAYAQGPTAAATSPFKSNPFQPTPDAKDELGQTWQVLNPQIVGGEINNSIYHLMHFVKDVFFDSQTTVGLLSNATLGVFPPGDPNGRPPNSIEESQAAGVLTAKQTAAVRDFVNKISGSQRMLAHGQIYPGRRSLFFMEQQLEQNHPDSWKGYTVATSARGDNDPPDSPLKMWRLDDEQIAYPTYEFIMRQRDQLRRHPGFRNICIHKGFSPAPIDQPEWGKPTDIPKASRDWPDLKFIIYHACFGGMTPFLWPQPGLDNIHNKKLRNGEPDITWLTEFAQTCGKLRNVYAEIGSTFGGIVITFPTVCAHLLGQLLKHFGEDKIVFGSDCVYYGSPQWQIEALWRFQIPESARRQYGYPELTERAKRKILGLNSARLYGLSDDAEVSERADYRPVPRNYDTLVPTNLKTLLEYPGLTSDKLAQARHRYLMAGADPSHLRYGWVRTEV